MPSQNKLNRRFNHYEVFLWLIKDSWKEEKKSSGSSAERKMKKKFAIECKNAQLLDFVSVGNELNITFYYFYGEQKNERGYFIIECKSSINQTLRNKNKFLISNLLFNFIDLLQSLQFKFSRCECRTNFM